MLKSKYGVNPIAANTSIWVQQIYAILQQPPKLWAVVTYDTDRFCTDYCKTHIPGNDYYDIWEAVARLCEFIVQG